MGAVWTVFRKEVLENLRDRRVILSAFFFGVLLAPVIFGLTTTMVSKRAVANQDKLLNLPIAGAANAPNLVQFLRENGAKVEDVELTSDEAMDAVRSARRCRPASPRRCRWSSIRPTATRHPARIAPDSCSVRTGINWRCCG